MLGSLHKLATAALPNRLRVAAWCLTDPTFRRQYLDQRDKVHAFREARRRAWPLLWSQTNGVVASGPFVGMEYIKPGRNMYFTPKLLGTYEKELWGVLEEICRSGYKKVIDIGAAEGYYVCGLARRITGADVLGFEADVALHELIRELASLNEVADRVEIEGICTAESLGRELSRAGDCLVVCDVEGAEVDLLDPDENPGLLVADILVEVHDYLHHGASETLEARFSKSHEITTIPRESRVLEDLPGEISLDPALALQAMGEFRGEGIAWMWMKKRGASDGRGA